MDEFEKNGTGRNESRFREEVFSKQVRAGKRTYFFDVKVTRGDEYYLTITESKKRFEGEKVIYDKHKIFLYKEDFEKFEQGLLDVVSFIKEKHSSSDDEEIS